MSSRVKVRFVVIGDIEPKVEPLFKTFRRTIAAINELSQGVPIDFTAGIGDLAHQGKSEQYQTATAILRDLETPFYTIMGNEEIREGIERFLSYAKLWNRSSDGIPDVAFVKEFAGVRFIFATAKIDGTTFDKSEAEWIYTEAARYPLKPTFIFTHAPMPNVFPDAGDRAMENDLLEAVLELPNVIAVFSGHIHLDLASVTSHTRDRHGVQHVHVPGIERTKIGVKHTPRFRLVTIKQDGDVMVQTFNVIDNVFEPEYEVRFTTNR